MMAARREKAAHTGGLKVALKVAQRASTRRSPTRSLVDLNPSPPTCSAAPERVGMLSQPSPAHTTPGGRAAAGQPAGAQRDSIAELNTFLRTTNSITQAKAKVEACLREGRCVCSPSLSPPLVCGTAQPVHPRWVGASEPSHARGPSPCLSAAATAQQRRPSDPPRRSASLRRRMEHRRTIG
jgi:hypothetical protein